MLPGKMMATGIGIKFSDYPFPARDLPVSMRSPDYRTATLRAILRAESPRHCQILVKFVEFVYKIVTTSYTHAFVHKFYPNDQQTIMSVKTHKRSMWPMISWR
jgi:hypothetical protein